MPNRPTKGAQIVYLELPIELVTRIDAMAAKMHRTRKAEIMQAIERHLAYPPEPQPLPPDAVTTTPEPKPTRGRGRPKGGAS